MYRYYTGQAVEPRGWLRRQLEIQAQGLAGNLDKVWPDVRDSAWIGGAAEGWERVPYWLDGFIPLAHQLRDADMIRRADRYVNAILDRQQPDGWICPCGREERASYDLWAVFLIGKVLSVYCEYTGSHRAETGLYRAMRNLYDLILAGEVSLKEWGRQRWFEAFIPLQYLYDRHKEPWIPELGRLLRQQGADYCAMTHLWKAPLNKWTHETHVVNLCMMIKFEAVACKLLGEKNENKAETLWRILEKYNGTAVGTINGDECLSGTANNQGTELCGVVELMYSCELLYAITGKRIWADRLEKLAFNALPATISDDMWTHQYVQQVNQIACVRFGGNPIFTTNNAEAHMFGLEPNFGCCTANMCQGWPKLTGSIFLKTKRGVECALLLPSVLRTKIKKTDVSIILDTEYPFRHSAVFTVQTSAPVKFELKIRIPTWAKTVSVDGETRGADAYCVISREWNGEETVRIELMDTPRLVRRPCGLMTANYGPLVFSLPVETGYRMHEYTSAGVERKYPYCDYELYPQSGWNYGFADVSLAVRYREGDEYPFSSRAPRLTLEAQMCPVKWDFEPRFENVSAVKPASNVPQGPCERRQLYPYGCAKLRMTEMPLCRSAQER